MSIFIKKVKRLFIACDQEDWSTVKDAFTEDVHLDYSLLDEEAKESKAEEIVETWKSFFPAFTHTHHQLGNFICSNHNDIANVFCYATISHYLENEGGNVLTVIGTFDIEFKRVVDEFKITSIKFNQKFKDGNLNLAQIAKESFK